MTRADFYAGSAKSKDISLKSSVGACSKLHINLPASNHWVRFIIQVKQDNIKHVFVKEEVRTFTHDKRVCKLRVSCGYLFDVERRCH